MSNTSLPWGENEMLTRNGYTKPRYVYVTDVERIDMATGAVEFRIAS